MDWFKRKDKKIKEKNKKAIPDGLWEKCPSCKEILFKPELDKNLSRNYIVYAINHYFVSKEYVMDVLLKKDSSAIDLNEEVRYA